MTTKSLLALAVAAVALLGGYHALVGGDERPVEEVVAAIADGATVIDVRRPAEYAAGHLAGARNVDLLGEGFQRRFGDLDPDEPVYLYCASGLRSGRAARILEGMGFTRVVNAGGYGELAAAGAPVGR